MPREWNTLEREAWNAPIHQILRAIDEHNRQFFLTGNAWHLEKASGLRQYLHELKTWIHSRERRDS
jgi:hypothetical protein